MTETIEISEKAFEILSRWASVSRTIKESIRLLDLCEGKPDFIEDVLYNIEELKDLVYPLDDCNRAAKNKKFQLQQR